MVVEPLSMNNNAFNYIFQVQLTNTIIIIIRRLEVQALCAIVDHTVHDDFVAVAELLPHLL